MDTQSRRVASTASGSFRLIIASMRARKKSSVCMLESPRNLLPTQRFSGESVDRVYTNN
jgi:hypothetical protein